MAEMTRICTDLHQGVQKLRNLDAHLNWKNHDLVKQKIVFQELFETEDHGDESAFDMSTEAAHIPSHGGRLLLHVWKMDVYSLVENGFPIPLWQCQVVKLARKRTFQIIFRLDENCDTIIFNFSFTPN